jgi:hypothetical protein
MVTQTLPWEGIIVIVQLSLQEATRIDVASNLLTRTETTPVR